jgi:hypothetical protein
MLVLARGLRPQSLSGTTQRKQTPNAQHRTPNIELKPVLIGRSMFGVGVPVFNHDCLQLPAAKRVILQARTPSRGAVTQKKACLRQADYSNYKSIAGSSLPAPNTSNHENRNRRLLAQSRLTSRLLDYQPNYGRSPNPRAKVDGKVRQRRHQFGRACSPGSWSRGRPGNRSVEPGQ